MSHQNRRLVGVSITGSAQSVTRLVVGRALGDAIRAVATHAGFQATEDFIEAMLVAYCTANHPEVQLQFERFDELLVGRGIDK